MNKGGGDSGPSYPCCACCKSRPVHRPRKNGIIHHSPCNIHQPELFQQYKDLGYMYSVRERESIVVNTITMKAFAENVGYKDPDTMARHVKRLLDDLGAGGVI